MEPAATALCGNAVDDDCDGATDEDRAAPRVLTVAVGGRNAACARASGRWRCGGTLSPGVPVPHRGDAAVVALRSNHACGGW